VRLACLIARRKVEVPLTDIAGNLVTRQNTSWGDVASDALFNGVTAGAFEFLPGVPGRLPKLLSESFFTGAHAQNAYAQEFAGVTGQFIFSNFIAPSMGYSQSTLANSTPLTVYQLTQQRGANIQSITSNWSALGSAVARYNSDTANIETK
jgi:hypothetical protein